VTDADNNVPPATLSPGEWLQRIAVAHAVIGVVAYRAPLAEIARARFVATVPDRGDRATAFWFLTAAPLLWSSGRLLRSAEETGDPTAGRAAGRVLIASGAIGVATMPVSGFWSVLAVGIATVRRARER
jgi:uncharacterized protein DUF6463